MLTDKEKELFNSLGFEVKNDKITKVAEPPNLEYTGFNLYWDTRSGKVFEKVGETMEEVRSPELEAEQRFLKNIV